jgi:hypothetical protein
VAPVLVALGAVLAGGMAAVPAAAAGNWRPVPLYGGGYSNLVRYNPFDAQRVLMATDVGGIHVSSDGGLTWQTRARAACAQADRVASIVWHPTLRNVAYALVGDGTAGSGCLLYSSDYGSSWTVASRTPAGEGNNTRQLDDGLPAPHPRSTGTLVAVDPVHGQLYVGTFRDGVMRAGLSATGAVSGPFSTIALAPAGGRYDYVRSIALAPEQPTTLYVGLHTGTLSQGSAKAVRIDRADVAPAVAELSGGPANVEELAVVDGNLYGVANDPAGPGSGLFRLASAASAAPAASWRRIPLSGTPKAWYSLNVSRRAGQTTIWVSSDGAWRPSSTVAWKFLWKGTSADGFATDGTWTTLPRSVTDTPNDVGGPSFVGSPDTWWMLTQGTYAWPGKDPGYTASDVTVSPADANTVIFAGQGGPWRTTDGGTTWYPVPNGDNILDHKRVSADPSTAGRAALGNIDWKAFTTGDSFRTADRTSPPGGSSHDAWSLAWDTGTSPATLYAGVGERDTNTGGQVWKTQTPGDDSSWVEVGTLGGGGRRPVGLTVVRNPASPGVPIVLAVVQGSGLWRKVGANPWTQAAGFTTAPTTGWPQTVGFAWLRGFHKVYVYDRTSGLWRSDDFGASWLRIAPDTTGSNVTGYLAAVPGNESHVVLSTPGSVRLLTNAGSAGHDGATGPNLGLPRGTPGAIAVSKANRLYGANTSSGIWATTLTATGVTGGWAPLDDATWHDMVSAPKELAADANGSVYAATSGGALVLDGGG